MSEVFEAELWDIFDPYFKESDAAASGLLEVFFQAAELEFQTWDEIHRKILDSHYPENCTDQQLRILAQSKGFDLPSTKIPFLRRFLAQCSLLQAWKGRLDFLEDAIFLATGISAKVSSPFRDEGFVWGVSVWGVDAFGPYYFPEPQSTLVWGESIWGESTWGSQGINIHAPYEIWIELAYDPGPDLLAAIKWVVDVFRRAIDIPVFIIPEIGEYWTIGVSTIGLDTVVGPGGFVWGVSVWGNHYWNGEPETLEAIQLPDGSFIEDA